MIYHTYSFSENAFAYDPNLTSRISSRSMIHLRDHLGSVRTVVNGDTGTVLEANDYYPFGKRIPLPVTESAVTVVRQAHRPIVVTAPVEATVTSTSSATATEVNIDATGGSKSKCKKTTFNNLTK